MTSYLNACLHGKTHPATTEGIRLHMESESSLQSVQASMNYLIRQTQRFNPQLANVVKMVSMYISSRNYTISINDIVSQYFVRWSFLPYTVGRWTPDVSCPAGMLRGHWFDIKYSMAFRWLSFEIQNLFHLVYIFSVGCGSSISM